MAIRNLKFGGTDFTGGETPIKSADINDTFDAVSNQMFQLIHSGSGSTSSTSEVELDTVSISANAFDTDDLIFILITTVAGGGGTEVKVRVADGTNTFTSAVLDNARDNKFHLAVLNQQIDVNTSLFHGAFETTASASPNDIFGKTGTATMIANWLSAAFTLSLRGKNVTGGANTSYFMWWVYRVKAL